MKSLLVCVAWLAAMPALAQVSVPQQLSYEGRLAALDGAPTTTQVSINFAIWSGADAGTNLWHETQQVTPIDGLYSVTLGAVASNPFPSTVFDGTNGTARYLEITINDNDTLSPRQAIGSVPYSMLSGGVQGGVVNASNNLMVGGNAVVNAGGRSITSYASDAGTLSRTGLGMFCGASGAESSGAISDPSSATTGYRATKIICERVCTSGTAHMCSPMEMVQSAELNPSLDLSATGYWVTSGMAGSYVQSGSAYDVSDCQGWTSGVHTVLGVYWTGPPAQPSVTWCDQNRFSIACCD